MKIIGRSEKRKGGIARVTGSQQYIGDIHLPDVLHVKLVHLECGHAGIVSIDTHDASHVDGVVCIMTADDFPHPIPRFGPNYQDRPVIAVEETKYSGEPVAVIAAETLDAAEMAASLVKVDYEERPGVYNVEAALNSGSPLVQDPSLRPGDPLAQTNILKEWHFGWGDVSRCQANCVIEHCYSFPMNSQFAIEPHAFLAAPNDDGVIIWSAIQHPNLLQWTVANILNLPLAKVRVIAPDPGGGFGGKGFPKFEPLLAFLAKRTGRPVRLALTLEESFQACRRTSSQVHIRSGFTSDGKIVFQDIDANFLIGAYADIATRAVSKASYAACGPYRVPDSRIISRALLSHTIPSTAFRGFGIPQYSWAYESQMDEAARRLGIDRVEIRRRNLPEKGENFIPGDTPVDGNWAEALEKAATLIGWNTELTPKRGRGISLGVKSSATTAASFAIVRLHNDGSASVMAGTSDMGQGARTIFAQIVAEELGISVEHVSVIMGDTAIVPFDAMTSASRSTVYMGNTIMKACQDVKSQLKNLAAETYSLSESSITLDSGYICLPDQKVSYRELFQTYFGTAKGEIIGVASTVSRPISTHPLKGKAAFWEMLCTAAEVEVDDNTGEILVTKLILVGDVGKALNPKQVETQDEGAAIMGLGHTLMEHLILDEHGRVLNLGALDYRIPTMKDLPLEIHSESIENMDGPGPYGSKGVGESGILATSPAIAAAVYEAIGVAIRDLPITAERVWRAMAEGRD